MLKDLLALLWKRQRGVHLSVDDHAFASGPVFLRPNGLLDAIRQAGALEDGRMVCRVWRQFEAAAILGTRVRLGAGARIINRSGREAVAVGDECVVRGIIRNEIGGKLQLSHSVYVGDGVILSSGSEVTIGEYTLIGHNAQIFDNDTHPVAPDQREAHFRKLLGYKPGVKFSIASTPVSIGRRCWVGMNSVVMKGVSIGDDTIIAAGSIVTKSLPAGVLAGGNPARPIKDIK